MSLNPNAPSFDPTAKPFIPSFLRNDPMVDAYVPPVYQAGPQFAPPLSVLAAGSVGDDDIPLVSGFKRSTKVTAPPSDAQEMPATAAAAGQSVPRVGSGSVPQPSMWRHQTAMPPASSNAAGVFPSRPPNFTGPTSAMMNVNTVSASLNAGTGGRANSHASLSSAGGPDSVTEKAEVDQPPIMGWSASSSMRRPPSTTPSGSPIGIPQQSPTNRYTASQPLQSPQQQGAVPSQPSPASLSRSQERAGLSLAAAPFSPPYGAHSPSVPSGVALQPHSPLQIVPPQPRQQQQQNYPSKIAPAVPRSAQERQAALAAAAAAAAAAASAASGAAPVTTGGAGVAVSTNTGVNAAVAAPPSSPGVPDKQPSLPGSQHPSPPQLQRGPSSPGLPAPRSEVYQQQQLQQQQAAAAAAATGTAAEATSLPPAPMPSRTAPTPNNDGPVVIPPRITSAPMARVTRGSGGGLSSGAAPYLPTAASNTASPYPGAARGLVGAPHTSSPPLPRGPPSAVGTRPSSTPASNNNLPSSGSPAGVTLSSAQASPATLSSVPAVRPLATSAAAPAPRPGVTAGLTGWRPPQFGRKAAPTNADPLVVLVFGCRGSGKTTQAENIAERYHLLHLSSGDMYKDGKQPYAEVEQAVKDHFGPDAKDRQYNGIVLDRFVATGEMDAYYLQASLNVCNLPVPIVFWLQLDPKEGMRRAQQRGIQKTGSDHWRYVEQRAQAEVADRVYKKTGVLHTIDCNAMDARRVWERIHSIIDGLFPTRSRNISLPFATPIPGYEQFHLLDDYSDFQQLTKEVHAVIGNTAGRTDSVPLSSIGGYVDESSFATRNEVKKMSSMYVTLKVDGQRFLVVKHAHFGVLGFPFLFTGCYDFNILFDPLAFPSAFEVLGGRHEEATGIEWMLDAELSTTGGGSAHPTPLLHIIDFVFFGGKQAKRTPFAERYELLGKWFKAMMESSGEAGTYASVVLKKYVPINELPTLLPRMEDAPFAVDGLVFQANSLYKFGLDKFLLKWKPMALCTADFRLMNSREVDQEDGSWTTEFDLYTTDNEREIAYPGAVGVFSEMEVRGFQLRNSVIAELELVTVKTDTSNTNHPETVWKLHRLRVDKPRPNKTAVVDSIVNLKHLSYEELLDHCKVLQFTGHSKN